MAGWRSWLGLGPDDEAEQQDPVQRTLQVLGQGAQDIGAGISQGAASVGSALSSYLPHPSASPAPEDYSFAPPDNPLATGLTAAGTAGVAAYQETASPLSPWSAPALAPARAAYIAERALPEIGGEVGAAVGRAAGGPDAAPYVTVPESVPFVGGQEVGPEQVGRFVGSQVTDPLTYVGAGTAAAAGAPARHVVAELARGLPGVGESEALVRGGVGLARGAAGRIGEAAAGNAERVAEPGVMELGSGLVPRRPTLEVLAEELTQAQDAVGQARRSGDAAAERAAADRMWALQDALIDARNARADLEPRIRSDVGRRIETLPLDERTAEAAAVLGRERVAGRPEDFSGPISVPVRDVNLNAGLGPSLSPGVRAPLSNAAQGGVLGAASESLQAQAEGREADPGEQLRRGALGAGLGVLAGGRARGGASARALGSGLVPTRRAALGLAPTPVAGGGLEGALATIPGLRGAIGKADRRAADMRARGLETPSAWDWIKQAGYAGIYGPATAVNSALGGAQELLLSQPKEAIRSLVEGRGAQHGAQVTAQLRAIPEGLAGFGRVLLGDAETAARASGGSQGTAGLSERVANPVGNVLARALEYPGQLLTEAPDALFRPAFIAQGEEREAARIAKQAGFTGEKARSFAETVMESAQILKQNPNVRSTSDEARRVVEAGTAHADALGYKGQPGQFGQWLAKQSKRDDAVGVLASFLMPFPALASRMATAGARSTPGVGLLPSVRRGQPRFDVVYDQAFGSLVAAGVAGWAYEGGITGSGPDDPEQRAELQATGWQPNATLVAGSYIPNRAFGRFQPMLDAAGELHDALAYQKPGEKKALVLDLAKRAGALSTDQVGLSGLADLYDMFVNDKGATFPGWAARSAVRYVPGGGILRAVAAATDPTARRPEKWAADETFPTTAIGQNLETAVPGLRRNVPAAQDVLGREAPNPQYGLGAFVPRTTQRRDDPLVQAYLAAGVDISPPPADIEGGALTPPEQRAYRQEMGARLQQLAGPLVASPGWASMPPSTKQDLLRSMQQTARELAEIKVRGEGGADLQRRIIDASLKKASGQ